MLTRASGIIAFLYEAAFTAAGQRVCFGGGIDLGTVISSYGLDPYEKTIRDYFEKPNVTPDDMKTLLNAIEIDLPHYIKDLQFPEKWREGIHFPAGDPPKGARNTFPNGIIALLYEVRFIKAGTLLWGVEKGALLDGYRLPKEDGDLGLLAEAIVSQNQKLTGDQIILTINRILIELQTRPSVIW